MGRRRRRRRGIFIIAVLFLIVIVSMFVGAAMDLAPWAFRRSANSSDLALAQRAARSGIEYALARLKQNPAWKGSDAYFLAVDTPTLTVVEEKGNVFGLLRNGDSVAQFRIRFNWQDGPHTGNIRDGLSDAPAALEIATPLVSFNNFTSVVPRQAPKADGPGYSVPATPNVHTVVPPFGVFLACEGRTGNWLRGASATNPNPAPPTFHRITQVRVETCYKVNNIGQAVTPAVMASAGTFKATLPTGGTVQLDSADNAVIGRMRSRTNLEFVGGAAENLKAPDGKTGEFRQQTGESGINEAANVVGVAESAADGLYKISWGQVNQAVDNGSNTLRGGVYTVWQDGTLHYYDMTLADYKTFMSNPANHANPGVVPAPLPSTMSIDTSVAGEFRLKVTGDTLVTPSAGNSISDLVIIPKKGADGGDGAGGGSYDDTDVGTALSDSKFWDAGGSEFDYEDTGYPEISRLLEKFAIASFAPAAPPSAWTVGPITMDDADTNDPEFPMVGNFVSTQANVRTYFGPLLATYLNSGVTLDPDDLIAIADLGLTAGGGGIGEIPAVPDTTAPQNIVLDFEPAAGSASAVLSGPSDINLGTRVEGEGGSITSEGNISVVGLGVDLSAATNPNEGVSLYAKGDILISTFDKTLDKYHDVGLKGVVYCWGNLTALLGDTTKTPDKWGDFQLTGALVAYGKDPDDTVTVPANGKVNLTAASANLKFDSSYLLSVMNALPPGAELGRLWWLQQ